MPDISINGIDGSGKSQQIRLLASGSNDYYVPKPLIKYNSKWPNLKGAAFAQWWFHDVDVDDLTTLIIKSLNARNLDQQTQKYRLLDRGTKMFMAVCAATRATRNGSSIDGAISITDTAFATLLDYQVQEYEILLAPEPKYLGSIAHLIRLVDNRSKDMYPDDLEEVYARYQLNLRATTDHYLVNADSIGVSMPMCEVQNHIRNLISDKFNYQLLPITSSADRIIGFSGLSESGKSTFAEYLRNQYGFYRLKLKYFSENTYSENEQQKAESIILDILRFLHGHYFVQRFSVESLHGNILAAMSKLMMGNQFTIVYIDTPEDKRIARNAIQTGMDIASANQAITEKDRMKRQKGVEEIRSFADIILDNSSDNQSETLIRLTDALRL